MALNPLNSSNLEHLALEGLKVTIVWLLLNCRHRPMTTETRSYVRSVSGQSMTTVCSTLYGFRRANSKNSVVPIDTNNVCSVVMAKFSMFIIPSLLLCARNSSIVRRSRMRASFSRCIDYNSNSSSHTRQWWTTNKHFYMLHKTYIPWCSKVQS